GGVGWGGRGGRGGIGAPAMACMIVIVVSALGLPAEPHYSVPVAPAFVLLAGAALLAPRRDEARVPVSELRPQALRYAGIGIAIVAAVWATEHYVRLMRDVVRSSFAPHALPAFLAPP